MAETTEPACGDPEHKMLIEACFNLTVRAEKAELSEQNLRGIVADLEEDKAELEWITSGAPCEKCGHGCRAGCYGCLLEAERTAHAATISAVQRRLLEIANAIVRGCRERDQTEAEMLAVVAIREQAIALKGKP